MGRDLGKEVALMAQRTKAWGKISRGRCEACKQDLGNRLDPYCRPCADMLERAIRQRQRERADTIGPRERAILEEVS